MASALLEIIYLSAIVSGIIIAVLLFKKSINRLSNRICGIYILALLIPLWNGYTFYNPELGPLSLSSLQMLYPWIFGPLLFLYCKALLGKAPNWKQIAMHLIYLPLVLLSLFFTRQFSWSVDAYLLIYKTTIFTQILGYCLAAIWFTRKQLRSIESYYASINPQCSYWLLYLLYGFFVIFVLDLILVGLDVLSLSSNRWFLDIFYVAESLYITGLGLLALNQPNLVIDPVVERHKYKHSALSQQAAQHIADELNNNMKRHHWYQENEISLPQVAKRLGVADYHLSQVLSEHFQQSFYEYVNRFRIKQAQELLAQNDSQFQNILDVAFHVGFNNKTSFNAAFKRFTKLTPSQFRKELSA